jgi:hypothetical protein
VTGLVKRKNLDIFRSIRDKGCPELHKYYNDRVISTDCAYKISLLPQDTQVSGLNEASDNDILDVHKFWELTNERRKEKNLIRHGIDPSVKHPAGKFTNPEEQYNLIYARLTLTSDEANWLADFPIHKHGADESIVCLVCPRILIATGIELLTGTWKLNYLTAFVITDKSTDMNGVSLNLETPSPVLVLVAGWHDTPNRMFEDAQVPPYCSCGKVSSDTLRVVDNIFGKYAFDRKLDITSGSDILPPGWTVWRMVYGVK